MGDLFGHVIGYVISVLANETSSLIHMLWARYKSTQEKRRYIDFDDANDTTKFIESLIPKYKLVERRDDIVELV